MSTESIIIAFIFSGAMWYLLRLVYQQFWGKNAAGCSKGCGSCAAISESTAPKELL
jgi:hypothetical protein